MMMVMMIQSAMMMIALHYNDSDKRDVPKIPRRSDDGNGDDGDGAQCNDDMMMMMPIAQWWWCPLQKNYTGTSNWLPTLGSLGRLCDLAVGKY